MNMRRIGGALLNYLAGSIAPNLLPYLLQTSVFHAPLFRFLDRRLNRALARSLERIQRERLLMMRAITSSVNRLTTNHQISSHVLRVILRLWGRVCLLYTSRAHETDSYLVCRLLLEKKKKNK